VSAEQPTNPTEAEETDVWWGACSVRLLIPGIIACVLVSGGVLCEAYLLENPNPARFTYWFTGPVWLLVLGWGMYQLTAFNGRLTTRRLFRARGFFRPPQQVELAKVRRVGLKRSPFERWLGLGRVYVDGGDGRPPLVLKGMSDAEQLAGLIRRQAQQAREGLHQKEGAEPRA
jgi:hypothetical protein